MVWPTDHDVKLEEHNVSTLPGVQLASSQADTALFHILKLDPSEKAPCQRLTGIVATIGPATQDVTMLEKMMGAGMNIARIVTGLGTMEEQKQQFKATIALIREAVKNYSERVGETYPLAIAVDLRGQGIKTGAIADVYGTEVELESGDTVHLTTDEAYKDKCSSHTVFIDFDSFSEQVNKGDCIVIDNETIQLRVEIVSTSTLTCKVERGGTLRSHRDVFLPNITLDKEKFISYDRAYIAMAVKEQVDIVIAPYVSGASCIADVRQDLGEKGRKIAIVAKVQTLAGFNNLDEILQGVDCIMISRMDLGTDITSKRLVIAQKNITARACKANVACWLSSQLLSSMVARKIPVRSETLDVSNCVIDGADALVLEDETSKGLYPLEAVIYLANVCKEAEACTWTKQIFHDMVDETTIPCDTVTGVVIGGLLVAQRTVAAAILVITTSGRSAMVASRYRPRCPIIAVTRYPSVARQLQSWRGVLPLIYEETPNSDWQLSVEERVNHGIKFAMGRGFVRSGDPVVLVTGWAHGTGNTNTMMVIYASEDLVRLF